MKKVAILAILLFSIIVFYQIFGDFFGYHLSEQSIDCNELIQYNINNNSNLTCHDYKKGLKDKGIYVYSKETGKSYLVADQFYDEIYDNKGQPLEGNEWIEEIKLDNDELTIKSKVFYSWDGEDEPHNNLVNIYSFFYLKNGDVYISGEGPELAYQMLETEVNKEKMMVEIKEKVIEFLQDSELIK